MNKEKLKRKRKRKLLNAICNCYNTTFMLKNLARINAKKDDKEWLNKVKNSDKLNPTERLKLFFE